MSFDQVLANYVTALNRFYGEQSQASYDDLIVKRTVMQERGRVMLEALQEILAVHANDNIRPKAFYIASNAIAKIQGESE